ncbi:MAG: iron(III) transport system permease protein [Alphaproteobacteria bacterium]|nr:iron(III) transport system permease protein [Alphaproteobacteria bacterium]
MADVPPAGAGVPSAARPRLRFAPRWFSGETFLVLLLALYVAGLALWPLARLFVEALMPGRDGEVLGVLLSQWRSPAVQRALVNTLEVSVLATLVSLVIGVAVALVLTLTDIRGKAALTFVALLPLLVPSQITALAWIEFTGTSSPILTPLGLAPPPGTTNPLYSMWGIVLVMGIEHSTLVFLAVRAGLRNLPRDLVEAARLGGAPPLRVTRSVIAPLAMPSILAGAALAFVTSIGNFGIPALLGIPGRYTVLTTLIYQRLQGFGPRVLGEVAALALILAGLAVIGLLLRALMLRRGRSVAEGSSAHLDPFRLGPFGLAAETGLWAFLVCIAVLPLLALLATSLSPALGVPLRWDTATLDNYRFALFAQDATIRAFRNSFVLALVTAIVSAGVAVPLAYLLTLRRNPAARVLDLLADAPYAVPGTVLAIAIILVFLPPLPLVDVSLYGTIGIMLVAYLARFLALALRPTMAGMELVNKNLDEAAQVAGAGVFTRIYAVILPVVAASAAAGALLVFMTAFNELTVSVLLWSTGKETLGVVVFLLHYEGNSPAAAAVATISIAVTLALAGAASFLGRNLPAGVVPWRA